MDDLKEKYIGKYIGPQKITDVDISSNKTPLGALILRFTVSKMIGEREMFEHILVPEKSIPLMVTDGETDWNTLSSSKMNIVIEDMIGVLQEYNIEKLQVDTLLQGLKTTLNFHFDRAKNFLWTGNDESFIPGYDPDRDVTLLHAESVIASIPHADREAENNNAS